MAYIGSTPTSQNFTSGTDYFSGTGSQTAFTLTRTVNSVNDIEVVINNVVQQPSTTYTLSGTTITFTSAPSSGTNNIYVRYLATNMQSFTVPANSITRTQLDSNLQAGFQGRNKIINGSMVVDQRNAGSSVTPTSDGQYTLDRWSAQVSQSSKFSVQQSSTAPVGFVNSLKVTSLSSYSVGATDTFGIIQYIEGYNSADLNWGSANAKTVTLSFWVQSSLTGTFSGAFWNADINKFYPFSYTISSANTWEQKTVTVAGDTSGTWLTTNARGISVGFNLGVGSTYAGTAGAWVTPIKLGVTGATSVVGTNGATFYITGVQLEEGTTATSFEREIYSVTLQKCQRYFYTLGGTASYEFIGCGNCYNTDGILILVTMPVKMRSAPTVSTTGSFLAKSNGSNNSVSGISVDQAGTQTYSFTASATATTGQGIVMFTNNSTSARFNLSSEL